MNKSVRCNNMNHGKTNPSVSFCPTCGEAFSSGTRKTCDDEKHKSDRKNRNLFCSDCGKDLRKF